jgi:heme a synthase
MNAPAPSPLVHRVALLTACLSLLPIVVGALVTTLGAGMAFLDWPSSDGRNMLLYPVLNDLAAGRTDKFVEHTHRLAGALIGLLSIVLAVVAWRKEPRRWVAVLATLVLLGVIVQGLLGGVRVLRDDPRMALVHGSFAALVFALMGVTAVVTGRRWRELAGRSELIRPTTALKTLSLAAPVAILLQYAIGGHLRHLGTGLHEHLGMAVVAFAIIMAAGHVAFHRGDRSLRRPAGALALLAVAQVSLGAGAWITRFGFASIGYVAVQQSAGQTVFRTSHTVVGMLLFLAAVLLALRVRRLDWLSRRRAGESIPTGVSQRCVALPAGAVPGGAR